MIENSKRKSDDLLVERFDEATRERIAAQLATQVHGESVKFRKVGGGQKVGYLETNHVIEIANVVFGPRDWSTELRNYTYDFVRQRKPKAKKTSNSTFGAFARGGSRAPRRSFTRKTAATRPAFR